ncbi:MAG: type III pantothenate kinase [Pirellulaceae bacterium]|nr:type III pantothenate kinase [Pirellulaceae bacterium]
MTAASRTATPLIAVDIGNSATKVGWFGPESAAANQPSTSLPQPLLVRDFPTGQVPPAELLAELPVAAVRWRVASVNREGERQLAEWVQARRPDDDYRRLTFRDLPLTVAVDFPDRVGVDRLAAAVGANVLREPARAAIVIGAGTAVTVDLVTADGAFAGGTILAGFRMQAEALFGRADLLPLALLAPQDEPPPVLGKNTEAAIRSGLFWGAVGAVREIATRLSAGLDPSPQIFVTGGDLTRLAPLVGEHTRYVPNLVLAGVALAGRSA